MNNTKNDKLYYNLLSNHYKHKKNDIKCNLDQELYILLKKKYKNYEINKELFENILLKIEMFLKEDNIENISNTIINNILSSIINEYE